MSYVYNQVTKTKKKITDLKIKLQKIKDVEFDARKEIQRIQKTLSRSTGASLKSKMRKIQRLEQKIIDSMT